MGLIGNTAAGVGMGILLGDYNDQRQINQERKLQGLEIAGQQKMAQFNYEQQMKMWNETNYSAQIDQMKKAGLNPGLMYGMGGSGGATTQAAQAQGPHTGGAPKGGGEALAMGGMGMQLAMTQAQTELLKAQKNTEEKKPANIEADTENTILDSIIKKYTGKEVKDTYEQVKSPNRGIEAKTYQDELEARQGIAGTIYELWVEGKLHDKGVAEIEQLLLENKKLEGQTKQIYLAMDLLEQNIKGAKLDNIIREIETAMQQQTGVDRSAPTWLKMLARLFGNILNR